MQFREVVVGGIGPNAWEPQVRLTLSQSPLGLLPEACLDELVRTGTRSTWKAGAYVPNVTPGIALMLTGRLEVYRPAADGSIVAWGVAGPGKLVGLGWLFGSDESAAIALTPATGFWLPIARLKSMLDGEPRATWALAREIYAYLLGAVTRLDQKQSVHLDERLLAYLLGFAEQGTPTITIPISHERLADSLGSRREVVTRILGRWAASGLVALGRNKIVVVDADRLTESVRPVGMPSSDG